MSDARRETRGAARVDWERRMNVASLVALTSLGATVLALLVPLVLRYWIASRLMTLVQAAACPLFVVAFLASAYFLGVRAHPPVSRWERDAPPRRPAAAGEGEVYRSFTAVVCVLVVVLTLATSALAIALVLFRSS